MEIDQVVGKIDPKQPRHSRMRTLAFRVLALLLGLVVSLGAAELTLRLLGLPREATVGWAWRGDPKERNELGFRGHRHEGTADATVVLLGDSWVEGVGTYDVMPEVFLRGALGRATGRNIRVVSIASAGWGQDQQLLALDARLPSLAPRIVVLGFTPTNDLWNNTFPTHLPKDGWPKPTFWLEEGALKGPNVPWMSPYRRRSLALWRAVDRIRGIPPYVTDAEWEINLPAPYRGGEVGPTPPPSLASFLTRRLGLVAADVPAFREAFADENLAAEKSHFSIYLDPPSPRLRYAATLTRALLAEIRQRCRERGIEFVILVRSLRPMVPDEPTAFEMGGRVVTLSMASARALIGEVLDGFPLLDLNEIPPDAQVSRTDFHLNAAGNEVAANQLARWLAPRLGP